MKVSYINNSVCLFCGLKVCIVRLLFIVVFFVLLIIDYSTKKGVLVYSRKCASEIVYFGSNPYIKQCELMC